MRTPPWWARRVVALAARALPRGPIRQRYEQEFVAKLHGMNRRQAGDYLLGIVGNAARLRAAVVLDSDQAGGAPARTVVPLTCRLNIRHQWRVYSTEDGGRYKKCGRCHKDYPGWEYYLWRYPGDNIKGSFGA